MPTAGRYLVRMVSRGQVQPGIVGMTGAMRQNNAVIGDRHGHAATPQIKGPHRGGIGRAINGFLNNKDRGSTDASHLNLEWAALL